MGAEGAVAATEGALVGSEGLEDGAQKVESSVVTAAVVMSAVGYRLVFHLCCG